MSKTLELIKEAKDRSPFRVTLTGAQRGQAAPRTDPELEEQNVKDVGVD